MRGEIRTKLVGYGRPGMALYGLPSGFYELHMKCGYL